MRLRFRHVVAIGAVVLSTAMLVSPNATAATTGTSPHWFTGHINQFRSAGSETTYYMMNKLGSLFQQTSIFGCTLQSADLRTCNTGADTADTDIVDDYDRNEIINGAGIGSGGGIGQLCGTKPTGGLTVDFARSSRGFSGDCADTVFKPLAKDALVGLDWPNEIPTGGTQGPVAAGWRTGDPVGGPYTGTAFNNISNVGGTTSLAYRIFCATDATRITDWGQLTDPAHVSGGLSDGNGATIGVPIIVWGVQTSSGTYSVWKSYVGCDPNTNATAAHVVQENNGPQIRNIAASEHPGDAVGTSQEIGQSLYYMSYGYYVSNAFSRGGGTATKINGVAVSAINIAGASPPATFRTLYNVYRTSTLRASVAGFLNWIHINDSAKADHGVDLTTGKNYFDEINNTISTQFGFVRAFDTAIPSGDIASLTT